ncbi:VTT domain-containing protein [Georgenia sp. SYP-B2076]|uniref:VTT domain-containing protein n=1 Tax=Georgenia sp. SYP-B2076 TaxID=2495881 RepID=UPI0013DFE0DB|nr:VTT domain-containing protein [Georgenia sp. SYP-B2076]
MNAVAEHILALPGWVAIAVVFLAPALESSAFVGFVFPGEIALILGGVLAFEQRVSLVAVLVAGVLGAVVGDSVGYAVGRRWGRRMLTSAVGRWVKHDHLDRAEAFLAERGGSAVFVGRFTAALRVLIPGLAGMARMRYRTFAAYNVAGGTLWAVAAVLLGYLGGKSWRHVEHIASRVGLGILVLVVLVFLLGRLLRPERRRRLAARVSSSERLRRLRRRHPRQVAWVQARFAAGESGLTLTVAVLVGAAALWFFIGTTQDVVAREEFALLDPAARAWLHSHQLAWLAAPAHALTWLGSTPVLVPILLVAAPLVRPATGSWWPVVELLGVYLVAVLLRDLVAALVDRPTPGGASTGVLSTYPSAHTVQAVVAAAVLVHVLAHHTGGARRRWLVPVVVVLAVLAAGAPLYLGTEWLTDVSAGLALAVVWLACCAGIRATLTRRPRGA